METIPLKQTQVQVRVNEFVRSVYNWMAIGLGITGLIAYYVAHSAFTLNLILRNPYLPLFAMIIWFFLGIFINARMHKLRPTTATVLYVIYASLMGFALSTIFLAYTAASIASTFFICAAAFIACSIFGWATKRDLTSFGGFLFMGLIGIIIASVVNIFVASQAISAIISYIGVFVFLGLTAYHTQHLKTMALAQPDGLDAGVMRKGAILGALSLYVTFINLFLFLLHIFGAARE
jgi:FtsH-binding integral membrane protein